MSWRSIQEILDYEFCPKYWEVNREHRFQDLSVPLLLERFDQRLKVVRESQQTAKNRSKNKKKRKRNTKQKRESMAPAWVIGAILLGLLFYYDKVYFFLLLTIYLLVTFFYVRISKKRRSSSSRFDVRHLLKEEVKNNQNLILLDPPSSPSSKKTNVFGEIPSIQFKKETVVVTLDRSDFKLPRYAQYASHRDLMELIFYMYLINTNFFTTNIDGIIRYQDTTRKIEWMKKDSKSKIEKSLEKIGRIHLSIRNTSSHQTIRTHFGRCAQCPLINKGCEFADRNPELLIEKNAEENVEKTYQHFKHVYTQLKNTTWYYWKDQIREMVDIIQSSPTIKKYLKSQVVESKFFDLDAMIDTAILNQQKLHNGHFSASEEVAFCYQLLFYLAEVRKDRLKPLMPAYGQMKRYDYRTSNDVKIRNFINNTVDKFLFEIGVMLEEHLENHQEKHQPNQKTVVYNYFRQTLRIDNNHGTIIRPTIKNKVELDE